MTGPELVVALDPAADAAPDGSAARVPDPVLGAALELSTGALELVLPDRLQPRSAFTFSAWLRWGATVERAPATPPAPAPPPLPDTVLVEADTGDPTAAAVAAGAEPLIAVHLTRPRSRRTRLGVALHTDRPAVVVDLDTPVAASPAALDPGHWHHLAVRWDGAARHLEILLDGAAVAAHTTTEHTLRFRRAARLAVVRGEPGVRRLLIGPVRLHRTVRTDAQLRAERHADLAAHPTVDERAPLGLRLADDVDEPTLSITDDDAPGRELHVVLENRSAFPVALPRASGPLADRLELRFRPGCLAGSAHDRSDPGPPGWRVTGVRHDDGAVSLFLGVTAARTLAPGAAAVVTLDHVRAAPDDGAHTTRVELHHRHPHHPGERSVRVAVARVVGRRGRRHSPLRLAAAGDGTVITDGTTPNTLTLHLANTSRTRNVQFRAPDSAGVATALVLVLDAGEAQDVWALATTDQLLAAKVSVDPPDWRIEVARLDEAPEWVLTPTRDQELAPSQRIAVTVDALFTQLPPGRTRAVLRTSDVPGYWDGEHAVELVKSIAAPIPPGAIVLWRGDAADVPRGWALLQDVPPPGWGPSDVALLVRRDPDPEGPDGKADEDSAGDTDDGPIDGGEVL